MRGAMWCSEEEIKILCEDIKDLNILVIYPRYIDISWSKGYRKGIRFMRDEHKAFPIVSGMSLDLVLFYEGCQAYHEDILYILSRLRGTTKGLYPSLESY